MTQDLLRLEDLEVVYSDSILALRGLSLAVPEGGIVALLGANGAGKSTTLKAISGLLGADGGRVRRGKVLFRGSPIHQAETPDIVGLGIAHVLEGRRLFRQLTVEENLRMGAFARHDRRAVAADMEDVFALFPRLRDRRRISAGYLSGGEQQMAAIGRALMARPTLMLLDEPTMGLAPIVAEEVFATILRLNRERGVSLLISEQNLGLVLGLDGACTVLASGAATFAGPISALAALSDAERLYFDETADAAIGT